MIRRQCLEIDQISYVYPGKQNLAISKVSCKFNRGEVTALVGPSASGKSTLGLLIKGLLKADSGVVRNCIDQSTNEAVSSDMRLDLVGWVDAHPERQFFESTVHREIAFGPANQGLEGEELNKSVQRAMHLVGLDKKVNSDKHPLNLSGGEKRLVALASAVSMNFNWFIFDEPTVGLDYPAGRKIIDLVRQLAANGHGVCWITHDIEIVSEVAERIWELKGGKLLNDEYATQSTWEAITERLEQNVNSNT